MISFLLLFASKRSGSGTELNRPYRSLLWGDGRTRRRLLRERLRNDRLLAILDVRPYLLYRSLPLGGNYIISRRDIQAKRGVPNRGVTAHQLPGVGIDLHGAAPDHQYTIILNDIPFAVDYEDALRGMQRRTNLWEGDTRRGRIQGGGRTHQSPGTAARWQEFATPAAGRENQPFLS